MSEPFTSFAQNFRILYQSLLALSSSAIVAISLITINYQGQSQQTALWAYKLSLFSFSFTIAIAIFASFRGLSHEVNEGRGSDLRPREINDKKFKIISLSLAPFSIGFCAFITTLLSL